MGEYADYEIDRIIGGFERRAERSVSAKRNKPFVCGCKKRFTTQQGLSDHQRDAKCGENPKTAEDIAEENAEWVNRQATIEEEQDFGA